MIKRQIKWLLICVFACVASFSLGHSAVFAQDDTAVSDDDVNRVASQLFCPTCEAIPVDVCPTEVCTDWRNEIRTQLAEGKSDREILDYFAVRYGSGVLANPPAEGFGLFIWMVPAVILALAAVLFARYVWQLQTAETPSQSISEPPQIETAESADDYRKRLEQELKQ